MNYFKVCVWSFNMFLYLSREDSFQESTPLCMLFEAGALILLGPHMFYSLPDLWDFRQFSWLCFPSIRRNAGMMVVPHFLHTFWGSELNLPSKGFLPTELLPCPVMHFMMKQNVIVGISVTPWFLINEFEF